KNYRGNGGKPVDDRALRPHKALEAVILGGGISDSERADLPVGHRNRRESLCAQTRRWALPRKLLRCMHRYVSKR
ncbi:MAG TPA: hypothetical protein VLT92_14290, partial [Burkholderiales bacterium]|nr:hypothetical protein [Burkholderiales bacterium]